MNAVGLLIRQLRIQKGFTQQELLDEQYSTTYLSRIENEQIQPSESFIEFISNRLNIPTQDLYLNSSLDEKEITRIYSEFRDCSSVSEKDVSLLSIYACQSFSTIIYLQLYSVLIRHYLQQRLFVKAEETVDQPKRFLLDIEHIENSYTGDELPYYFISCGNLYYFKQDFFKADEYYSKANEFRLNKKDLANLFYNISITKQRIFPNKNISLYYSKKAYNLYKELNLVYKQNRTMITISIQNQMLGNCDEAINQLNMTKGYMTDIGDIDMLSKISNIISVKFIMKRGIIK